MSKESILLPRHVQHFKQRAGHLVVVKVASQPYSMQTMIVIELLRFSSPAGAIGQKKLVFGDSLLLDKHIVAAN